MNNRISFLSSKDCEEFFQIVKIKGAYDSWISLAKYLDTSRTVLEKYRSGKLTLPNELYLKLIDILSSKERLIFNKKIEILSDNWGRVKGGKITYRKYNSIFKEGRKKGIEAIRAGINKKHFITPHLTLTEELSYIIGLFIGDGFTNKYNHYYQTQFTGHRSKEEKFYLNYVIPMINRLLGLKAYVRNEKNSDTIRINFYSRAFYEILTKRFGISPGLKFATVLIPTEILSASDEIQRACVAGIYDAEACVFLDKRVSYKKPYPRIDLHMQNPAILSQINSILIKHDIQTSFTNKGTHLLIYGFEEVKKFCSIFTLHNPKYLAKLAKL
ncbi:MAG: hypothetical protein Q7R87_01955 [Nanoarchaeota archaeon]|nr:hypothetical protein [Nanoarchaeota archaeon]